MLRLILYPEGKFNFKALVVILLAIVSGAAVAGIAIIVNEAAGEIIEGRVHLKHLPYFLVNLLLLIITRRYALRSGTDLVEQMLESYRNKLGNQVRQLELMQMEKMDKSEIYIGMTVDPHIISMASQAVIRVVQSLVIIVVVCLYILKLSKAAGFIFFILFAVGVLCYKWHQKSIQGTIQESLATETELFETFRHALDGFKELKINSEKSRDLFQNHIKPIDEKGKMLRTEIGEARTKYVAISFQFLFYLSLGSMVFILPYDLPLSVRFKLIAASAFLWEPLGALSLCIPEILNAKASAAQLSRLDQRLTPGAEPLDHVTDDVQETSDQFEELKIHQMRFDYTNGEGKPIFSIGPLDLTIKSGEILFFIGGNGGGKSTMLKLLTGLYPALSGTFYLNGAAIRMAEFRHLFSVIFSDCHLFDGLYGIKEADDDKVYDLLRMMYLDHKVFWQDKKFLYSGLSSGQKKRLALITALLEDRPIYIFDEWAAEQDPVFKKYFYKEFLPSLKAKGKTILAATHDDQYFDVADRVIKMEYGKINNTDS